MGIAIAAFSAAFVAHKKGGFGTRQRAGATWRALNSFVESKRWKDVNPNTISTKQIRAFVEHRQEQGVSARSIQNEVSHIRRACIGAGRDMGDLKDVKNNWSAARLGVPAGSRIGGKRAIDPERLALALQQVPPDVATALRLSEALGLRRQEAVMAGSALAEWERALEQAQKAGRGAFLPVGAGTKGGVEQAVVSPAAIWLEGSCSTSERAYVFRWGVAKQVFSVQPRIGSQTPLKQGQNMHVKSCRSGSL